MNSFTQYLYRMKQKYPLSELTDYFKQIYQSEFAGGHLITDINQSLTYLECELQNSFSDSSLLYEYISDNMVRINIHPFIKLYNIQKLNDMFYSSSLIKQQNNNVHNKCNSLRTLFINKKIDDFEQTPIPFHHSTSYNKNYNPHYRVIDSSLLSLDIRTNKLQLFLDNLPKDKLTVIALEGRCASGKTTISNNIKNATIINADDFFSKNDVLDFELLYKLLSQLEIKKTVTYKVYSCSTNEYYFKTIKKVEPIVIIEGVYSYHPKIRKYINRLVYVETTKKLQYERLKQRTENLQIYNKFINVWIPREEKYFNENTYIIDADIII